MKKILPLLALMFIITTSAQETLLSDYSVNKMGEKYKSNKYDQLFLSTYTNQNEGKAYDGILIKGKKGYASSRRPYIEIPVELVPEFQTFLINGKGKYLEWLKAAQDNNISDMKKTIAVFTHKLRMVGDDYGYVGGMTDAELNFDLKEGIARMYLQCYVSNSVRSDLLSISLMNNNEKWRELGLLRLIDYMTTEKVQAEIDKINNSANLFKN